FIEELMTGRRTSVVAVTGRTSASALRAVRLLSEAPIPIPEDWFNVQPLVGFLRWEVIGKHPELGSVVNLDSDWPRVEVHPALQRGFDDLAFTLACGFGRHEVPPEALLSDRHRLLARLVAQDRRVPKLVRGVRVKDLAHYLAGLVSPEDLEAVREELRLECAAVASRLPEVMAHVEALRALSESASPKGRRKRKGRDPRRAHAYDLVCNEKLPLKEGLRLFNARADQQGWDTVETIQGLRDMAAAYAADFGRPRPPSRYSK
ncbi:MAG TPA: hypothetical protein VKD90_08490, partial [Gemmataceae bacterium]|nr:hypothetical protein [Gemmataceae bacterium]